METHALEEPVAVIVPEDVLRAQFYNLLANLLRCPPSQKLLDITATLKGHGDSDFSCAIAELAEMATNAELVAEQTAYDTLFIGVGRGKLLPYASHYLTGFLNEKPLAELRETMGHLGIGRKQETHDPEDHIASLMEMMGGLIIGAYGAPFCLSEQQIFFEKHIHPWAHHCFKDLSQENECSQLFSAVGKLGMAFMDLEVAGFEMSGQT